MAFVDEELFKKVKKSLWIILTIECIWCYINDKESVFVKHALSHKKENNVGTLIFYGIILIGLIMGLMNSGETVIVWGIIITIIVIAVVTICLSAQRKMKEKRKEEAEHKKWEEEERLKNEERNSLRNKIKQNTIINDFVSSYVCGFCERVKASIYYSRDFSFFVFKDYISFGERFGYEEKLKFQVNNLPDLKDYDQTRVAKAVVLDIVRDTLRKNLDDNLYKNIEIIKDNEIRFNRLPNPNTEW